jgi:mono/diheme cytochrome c family protein
MAKQLKKMGLWKKILAILPVLAMPAVLCGWGQEARSAGDAQYGQGKKLFNGDCRVCHILKSEGDQPSPYYLRFRPGDFSDPDFWKNHSDGDIEKAVKKGKGAMPPQPLTSEEIKAVIHFMKIEFKK